MKKTISSHYWALSILFCSYFLLFSCKKDEPSPTPVDPGVECETYTKLDDRLDDFRIFYQDVTGQPVANFKYVSSRAINAHNMTDEFFCFLKKQYKKSPALFVKGKNDTTHGDQVAAVLYSEDAKVQYEITFSFPGSTGSIVFKVFGYDKKEDGNWYRTDSRYLNLPFDK